MGGSSSSPRTETLEADDDGSTVVSVSEAVAKRLLGREDTSVEDARVIEDKPVQSTIPSNRLPGAKEDKLKMLEAYEERINALEKYNSGLQEIGKEEFSKAVREVESKFMKHLPCGPVCVDLQEAVTRCYLDNPTTTLNCATQVQAFKECVDKHRQSTSARKG